MRNADKDHLAWLKKDSEFSFQSKSVLDLGCGSGYLCQLAKEKGAKEVYGIDICEPEYTNQTTWNYLKTDLNDTVWVEQFKNSGVHFDIIFAFDILEHLDSPWLFLKASSSLLKPNGKLVLTTPNTASWECLLFPKTWSGSTDSQHKTLFTPYSLKFLLNRADLVSRVMTAPIRKLGIVNRFIPPIGGQIFCTAEKYN